MKKRNYLLTLVTMKKILVLIFVICCMTLTSTAQSIVGKWKCPAEFLDSLGLQYNDMSGYYKFKKNGTFVVKINGVKMVRKYSTVMHYGEKPLTITSAHKMIYIKVKGTYEVANNRISTKVAPDGVYCFIDPGVRPPKGPDADDNEYVARMKEWKQDNYERAAFKARIQAQTVKEDLMRFWVWDNEPLTVTKESLAIGDKFCFKRK